MPTQTKIETVNKLVEQLKQAKAVVFTDYRGLTHKQLEELRRALRKLQADYLVAKNTLMLLALAQAKYDAKSLKSDLAGPTATLIALGEEIAPLKEIMRSFKLNQLPVIKFAFLGDKKLTKEEVMLLALLPSKDVLLTQLVGQLNASIFGLHYSLSWNLRKLVYVLEAVKVVI
ncbi:50S ribosomal protein L10 [Candidatus Gottesmanbacteria bacterium]|nr:50S ribosomal protein L10 [Candidatus Gottesmanbacteria bacterium]